MPQPKNPFRDPLLSLMMTENNQMPKRDLKFILIIGAAVGVLIQPILANTIGDRVSGIGYRVAIFLSFLIFAPLALWIASLISRWWHGIYQFAQFAAVGTLNTFIDVGVFNLETFLYGSPFIATALFALFKAISFLCSTTNSFFWNKYWTFGSTDSASSPQDSLATGGSAKKPQAKQVASFYVIAAIGWALNVGVATLVKTMGAGGPSAMLGAGDVAQVRIWVNLVAPLAGVAASFLWDFFGYKYLVFRK